MSSREVSLLSISLKQYLYKLKAYSNLLNWLILAQVLGLLFTLGGVTSSGTSNNEVSVSVTQYSSNVVIIFTCFWLWIVATQLPRKQYKNLEITLVTNRLAGNLSNIAYLLTACVFGGITASLGGVFLRVIMYLSSDKSQIILDGFFIAYADLLLGMAVGILYMVLISSIGYFFGALASINMALGAIVIVFIIGILRIYPNISQLVYEVFVAGISLPLFALSVIGIAIVLFGVSIILSNRLEMNK